jgi:hypothetical protein
MCEKVSADGITFETINNNKYEQERQDFERVRWTFL